MAAPQAAGYGAGAGLTSVVQEGPGRFRATFANGNSIPLTGQTGQNLYDKQQAAVALSQPREQPTTPEQVAPAPQPSVPGERVGTTVVSEPQGGQAEPETAAQEQTGPVSLGYTMKSVDPTTGKEVEGEAFQMPDGSIGVYQAPRAGSPGGLTALGKQTMAQFAQSQLSAGEHGAKAAQAQQIGVDLAVQDAEARQGFIEEQKIQTQLELQKQADEEAAIQQKVAGLEASYQKASEAFRSARIDPDRYVKSKPGGNWILGLSAALGALGAGLARTPNFAMEFINARIADDVRSQEAEINVKGRDADNQLAGLTRALGDLKLAKTSYRQLKLEEASYEAQRVAGQFKGQQIANNALMVAEQSAAAGALESEKRVREFNEHVFKEKLYFRQGSAGTRGGFTRPQLGGVQAVKNLVTEKTDKELARAEARAELHPVESGRTEKISAFAAGIDSALRITQQLEKRGVTDDVYDDPQAGPLDRLSGMEDNADLRRDTTRLASGYQAARGKSDKDAELAEQDAIGSGSGRDRYKSAQAAVESFAHKAREELVTLPPNKQQELLAGMSPEARAAITGQKK